MVEPLAMDETRPCAFFDGACSNLQVGLGFLLHLGESYFYAFKTNGGEGTNNVGELLACIFLESANHIGIQTLQVLRKYSLVINHLKGTIRITSLSLQSLVGQL